MNQSCINRKAIPNFKFLAEYHKVSEDKLSEIIYKYRNETSDENAMPTETYIQAQIGKIEYLEPSQTIRKTWDKFYSTPKEFTSEQKFQEAKAEAETIFPKHAVLGYTDDKGNSVLAVKRPVEKIIPKHRKDYKSWQEYNDYILVMGDLIPESAREKEQQVIGKQPFTFKDGTTVTVPFRPNSQQEEALNEMSDFLKSDETAMTLSGYAGTGKTSLMEIIAAKAKKDKKKIIFSASTNKAASVLRDRVKSAGYTAETLNKVFGIAVAVDETQPYDESTLKNIRTEAGVSNGAVVVIDEASMINVENYNILNEIARENNLKIIYVGDKGQLPPVNETQISKVFRDETTRRVNLTKVERTDDNAILKEATNIRNGQPLSGESSFNKEGKGVAYVKKSNKEAKKAIVERFVPHLKENPDYFRILAYTNATVAQYNEAVRRALGYTDNTPRIGEPIVGYKNWGQINYNKRTKQSTYKFINSESYKVVKVGKPKEIIKTLDNGVSVKLQALPVTLENSLGEKNSFDFIDVKNNPQNLQAATVLAQEKARIHAQARGLRGEAYAILKSKINDLEKFLFINADIEDKTKVNARGKHPLLQGKVFDFGYAMTVHKSQGSTFKHVMVDDADIAIARGSQNNMANAIADVELGEIGQEANENTKMVGADDVDLGDLSSVSSEPIYSTNPDGVNIRQQLEYVAVSRATDTVTIIANDANVKKEDTPLNHVKPSTNSTPSTVPQPVAIENTPKPADQMNRRELWEHLESLAEPMGERPISYTPVGKTRQEYIVRDGKVYNKKGEEVHYQGKDMNRILANLAVAEDRGVVVTYRDNDYVVDNHQNITSVTSGDIMKWGPENGDRKAIIQLAEQKFKTLIENRQNRLSEMVPELMDLFKAQGINVNDKAAMEKFLKENPQWSTKIQQFIGKKARTQFEQQLMKARPDLAIPGYTVDGIDFVKDPFSDDFIPNRLDAVTAQKLQKEGIIKEGVFSAWALTDKGKEMAQVSHPEIDATLDFLHSLEDNKENTAYIKTAIRWIANRSLTLPQDHTKAYQAFELARKKHLDLQKYNTLGELITAPEMQPKKKEKVPFNPNKAKTFSNKRTVTTEGGRVFIVYDVEDTEEGQREVCKALAAHYGMSPWCLSTFTATGEPTESAKKYWAEYSGIKRKIAFENGKPVAFSSDYPSLQPKSYYTIDGREIPPSLWFPNMLMQNQTDGVGSKEFNPETLEYLVKNAYVERNSSYDWVINDEAYRLTEKGERAIKMKSDPVELEDREAWWDMEDTHPQTSLSDSIVSEYRTPEQQERAIVNPDQEEVSDLPFFITPEGEVYGFADQKGELYFDEDKVSPNVQIHEYTHLWDRAVAERNPKLWKRGVDLMKQTSLWNEVLNETNYGQKWKAMNGMTPEKMKSLIASEVHSRLTGTQGEALLNRIAKEKGSKGIVAKLKQWILDFWKELKGTFSNWSDEEINNLTLEDFNKMTVRDLIDKVNLKEQQSPQQQPQVQQQTQQPVSFTESTGGYPQRTRENITWSDVTLAFANDDTTAGEKLTEREANNQGKYISEFLPDTLNVNDIKRRVRNQIIGMKNDQSYGHKGKVLPTKDIKLNIAGNGIYTLLPKGITQEQLNDYVTEYIREMIANGVTISEIRSGGQTGVDEAGIIAAQRLGIPASVHAPKGFLLRTAEGKDVADKNAFENRFNQISQSAPQFIQQDTAPEEEPSGFIPYPLELDKLGIETGERVVQVDAEWKVPILLDLNAQISEEFQSQENQEIVEKIHRVLHSATEEDYLKAPTAERQEVNDKISDYWRRNNQMNALMDNDVNLSASEIREVSEQIVNSISDIITELQSNPEKVKEYFPTLNIKVDLQSISRKEIAKTIGINNLINEAKRRFENIRYDEDNKGAYDLYADSFELMDQADLILDNWDTIMELAADVFVVNEGFSIKRNTKKQSFETEEREFTGYDYDNFIDPQDEDAVREEKDEQEHWQIEARTIDAFNSMSELVRLAYHNCYVLDRNGNKVLDKWGIPKRVNKVEAVAQTLRWTQGTLNINEMIEKLHQKERKFPWLNQLLEKLEIKEGQENPNADFQSQFYGVMHRHFQLYSIGQMNDGKYSSITLNNHIVLSGVIKNINAKFQLKEHPLFHKDGAVILSSLNGLKKWHKELSDIVKKYNIRTTNEKKVTSNEQLSEEDIDKATKNLTAASRMLGYNASEESVKAIVTEESLIKMTDKLRFAIEKLEKAGKDYDPFNFDATGNIRSEVMGFLTPIVEELEDAATNSFFESGKMYQSYVIPSFLTQLFDQFKQSSDKVYQWMDEFYGQSEWFKDKEGNWRLPWLDDLYRDPRMRELFDHKVQLNFNKHDYMRNMSPEEFTLSVITEYFSELLNKENLQETPVWFRVPIQSNKPSSEFIKFHADRGIGYKERIVDKMYKMFLQELSRIDTVRKRNLKKEDSRFIASFDENGRKFMFLPWLNPYLEDSTSELGKLLQKKLEANTKLTESEEARLITLVKQETMEYMQQRADRILQNWEEAGIIKAAKKVKNIESLGNSVKENLENFLWNDFYAANSILQMTIVDKAFYPHATELQKRLAELHAPGTRGNKYATDYNGNRVSDGFYRTILIKDLEGFTASIIDNITEIFDRKIANAPDSEKPQWEALKESLVGENGAYRRINVTDGQAYSSPSSYRKKAFMFGKWSRKAEDIYQRLLKGDFSISDLETAFQPLKPFVYGHLSKDMGVDVAPITKMPIPFQAKNSEYLLILADALMRGQETGRPNILKAIYDIMEESERLHPGQGIDTVQFNSAIKSGNQAVIDITSFLTMPGGEAGAYTLIKKLIYQEGKAEDLTSYNYDTYVHKTDYDNFALQQEVPPHFREHQQAEGSQQRMNIPADLDFYDYNGQVNKYSWKDPDGTEHSMNAKEFRKEYERVHAANIEDSFNTLAKELHLNSSDIKARNLAISEILQDEILSSPRYGLDLFLACQIDPATGEFRIPKGDPIQGKRIEQLINSIIKNRVNKQKISGGPIVQVTNFGTSKQLHIRFQDKDGNILMTKEEYEKSIKEQPISQTDKFNAKYGRKTGSTSKSYKEYLRENQAGIAHFEIFAPIGMKKLFDKFKNPDGSINLEAVEKCDPELLKVITGRIPNEDKYSIAHGKIVGFMPALAGDGIMFPYELTEIDDSDFDVDKRYTMQKVIDIVEDRNKIEQRLYQVASESYKKAHNGEISYAMKKLNDAIGMLMDNPERMKSIDALSASLYEEYQRILREEYPYKTKYPKKGTRDANNNQIIDMSWAVMSNEMTADKILNPGGFEIPKHTAYVIAAYRNSNGTISWEELDAKSTKELQKLASVERDLAWFNDHVQFYKQNAAGSNLIGVFAVNKVAHATLEGDGLLINVEEFCEEKPFTICDMEFSGMMPIDSSKDAKGQLIGKNIGSGIGASADTAKDPWLDSININMTTAGMFNTLLRMGMPMEDAELFMAQDVIQRLLTEFNRKNLEGSTTIDKVLQDKIDILKKKYKYTESSEINSQPLTREELKEGLIPVKGVSSSERDAIDYKTLIAFQKLKVLAKAIRKPTTVTRLNSISSAVGPLVIDNIILEHKLMEFLAANSENRRTGFYKEDTNGNHVFNGKNYKVVDMDTILEDHPILEQFSRPIDSRNPDCPTKILFSDVPAGSSLFKTVLNALPQNIVEKIYDDRQLLSKLSDFFQSYLLVANNVIKPEQLEGYIKDFPKEFETSIKEQYPNNAFIQAIQLNYEKKSNRAFLNINTTGMKEQEKEKLRMAWTDLHKENPELSTRLFLYAFFRGGIGFSPKTWMGLTPIYVKERIKGYVDTYRHFPGIVPEILIEQFIRNNWDNSTLAPIKGGEGTNYDIRLDEGILRITDKKDWDDTQGKGIDYMKTVDGKNTYLWKFDKHLGYYTRIYPLGNNGEYFQISATENLKPIEETTILENPTDTQELPETSQAETDAVHTETPETMPESDAQQAKTINDLIPAVMALDSRKSPSGAREHLENYVSMFKEGTLTTGHKKYLVNLLTKAGIDVSTDTVLEKFKEFC